MRILFVPAAFDDLDRVPEATRLRILDAIERFAASYPNVRVLALRGVADRFRLRVGDYRVIFAFEDGREAMVVLKIGRRRQIYRDLD